MTIKRFPGRPRLMRIPAEDVREFRYRIARAREHAETLYDEVTSIASDLAEDEFQGPAFQAELCRLRILMAHRGLEEAEKQLCESPPSTAWRDSYYWSRHKGEVG